MNKTLKFSVPQAGIRAKLSFFTALFVSLIIGIVSIIYLKQQYKTLTESLDREIQPLRRYTEKIVLDLENISFTFLLVEDFRYRLKAKQTELQKYKRQVVKVVEEKSWFTKNILGKLNYIQKGLIDTEDKKVSYSVDTFFSEYITEQKIREIEESIYFQMRDEKGKLISKEKFSNLQKIAFSAEEIKRKVESLKKELENFLTQKENLSKSENAAENQKSFEDLEKKISSIQNQIEYQQRKLEEKISELNQEILKFFYQSQKNNIQELGLNTNQIRIQTFDLNTLKQGFDTKIFSDFNFLNSNQLINHDLLSKDLEEQIRSVDIKKLINLDFKAKSINLEGNEYEIFFNPILKKPDVVHRAKRLIDLAKSRNSEWKEFFEKDQEISQKLGLVSEKLKKRLEELRAAKLTKPSQDKEYSQLYKEYVSLVTERKELTQRINPNKEFRINNFENFTSQLQTYKEKLQTKEQELNLKQEQLKTIQNNSEISKIQKEIFDLQQNIDDLKYNIEQLERKLQNWTWTPSLLDWDAISHLREAALFEYGILRYKYNTNSYLEYLEDQEKREIKQKKWEAVRRWIIEAESETKVKKIIYNKQEIDPFEGGVLSRSRSEMEEFMWKLDSTPLFIIGHEETPQGLATELFVSNISGFTRTIVDKTDGLNKIREDIQKIIYNAGFVGISALALAFLFSSLMVKNIRKLSASAELVGKGNLKVKFDIQSHDEIGKLSQTLNQMVIGLVERDKVKNALGKFVNPQIAEMVLKQELKLGGERKMCAIFFSDIRGFTAISEKLEPENVVEFLNEYLTEMVKCVNKTHGIVDKFIGDAIMATWGAAYSKGNDAENAVNAALLMREALLKFNEGRGTPEKPIIQMGCGLNYGPVIAGQIGSEERLEYTVIGDAVNLASRVEALNKPFGTDILITQDLYNQVKELFLVEKMQAIQVKGKQEPQIIYAVLGRKDDPNAPKNLEELRARIGISFDPNQKVNIEEKEEKFKILENETEHSKANSQI